MLFNSLHQKIVIYRPFHTSSPRHIHPLIWIFLKPALKGVAWLTGRTTRKWYRQLPLEKQSIFIGHLQRTKYRYFGIFGTLGSAIGIFYYTHLETVPITGRRRYMLLNKEKLKSFFEWAGKTIAEDHCGEVFPADSKETQLVARVAKRILASNMDIPDISTIKWTVRVINTEEENAMVTPTGDIYVFGGLFKNIKNEDQLAVTLGHEMAHAILGHGAEELSYSRTIDALSILGAFFIWSIFPSDWTSFCVNYIFDKFIKYTARLPYSRRIEEEADAVGLLLAAKACYDVRQSVVLWASIHNTDHENETSEYRSTHPSHINRVENLIEMIPWALDMRTQCKCSVLPHYTIPGMQNYIHLRAEKTVSPWEQTKR